MHILIVCQYFYPENFRINDIATEWVKSGHKVSVITGIPNYPEGKFYKGYSVLKRRYEEYNGVFVHRLPIIPRGHSKVGIVLNYLSFMVSGGIWARITRVKADVVFSFETSPMTQVLVGTRYAKRTKTRHIVYVQDLWPENVEEVGGIHSPWVIRPIDRMVKYIYRNADLILGTSESFVQMIRRRMESDPKKGSQDTAVKVRYWPQYAERFYQPCSNDEGLGDADSEQNVTPLRVIFTGNIGYAQGLEILPECASVLAQKEYRERVRFILVGDGRARETLVKTIDKLGVSDMFEFKGRKKPEKIPGELSRSDVAFLSFADNKLFASTIPAKLQSYIACGMPVLASALGETKSIIEKGDCGICVPPGDANALADAIVHMARLSKSELERMSRNSLEYSRKHFDQNTLMDQMEEYLTGV